MAGAAAPGITRTLMELPLAMIQPNPLAPMPTLDEMRAMVDKVEDPETWAQRLGVAEGHSATLHGRVARLLRLGVERWHWDEMSWSDIERLFPTATPSTYWIVLHTETCGDRALYQRLAEHALSFHGYVWRIPYARRVANAALLTVVKDINEDGLPEWMQAVEQHCHASATSKGNPTGKGKGRQSSKGHSQGKS